MKVINYNDVTELTAVHKVFAANKDINVSALLETNRCHSFRIFKDKTCTEFHVFTKHPFAVTIKPKHNTNYFNNQNLNNGNSKKESGEESCTEKETTTEINSKNGKGIYRRRWWQ